MLLILRAWAGIETTEQLLRAPKSILAFCYAQWQRQTRKDDRNQIGSDVLRNVVQQWRKLGNESNSNDEQGGKRGKLKINDDSGSE